MTPKQCEICRAPAPAQDCRKGSGGVPADNNSLNVEQHTRWNVHQALRCFRRRGKRRTCQSQFRGIQKLQRHLKGSPRNSRSSDTSSSDPEMSKIVIWSDGAKRMRQCTDGPGASLEPCVQRHGPPPKPARKDPASRPRERRHCAGGGALQPPAIVPRTLPLPQLMSA